MRGLFGPDSGPAPGDTLTTMQRVLRATIAPQGVVSKWTAAMLGAVIALVLGLLMNALFLAQWQALQNDVANLGIPAVNSNLNIGGMVSGIAQYLSLDLFKMLVMEHGVPLLVGDTTVHIPLLGYSLIPAVALLVGGYISSASDYQRQVRYSIARGALIAPLYAAVLAILAFLSVSEAGGAEGGFGGPIALSVPLAFVFGLLWGVLFGGLGGWAQYIGGRASRGVSAARGEGQPVSRGTRLGAAVLGALVSVGSGLLLSFVVCLAGFIFEFVYNNAYVPPAPHGSTSPQLGFGQVLVVALTAVPMLAAWVFAGASGGPFVMVQHAPSIKAYDGTSLGLVLTLQKPPSVYWYLLLLLPIVCYLVGGRAAARAARARTMGEGLVAGALAAIPTALLMAALAYLTRYQVALTPPGGHGAETFTVGMSVLFTLVAALIFSAVVGALGGASQVAAPAFGGLARLVTLPIRPFSLVLGPSMRRLTGRPASAKSSVAGAWLTDALAATVVCGVIAVAFDVMSFVVAGSINFDTWAKVAGVVAAVMVAYPLLCYCCALVTAFGFPRAEAATEPVGQFSATAPLTVGVGGRR